MGKSNVFQVTTKAQRPASMDGCCFYCLRPIGSTHKGDCVLIRRKVKVRMVVEYEIAVPSTWTKEQLEFHRNDSSWCANNALKELEALVERDVCLCDATRFEYVGEVSGAYLDEG